MTEAVGNSCRMIYDGTYASGNGPKDCFARGLRYNEIRVRGFAGGGDMPKGERRLPVGAEVTSRGVSFRVWAPRRKRVSVVVEGEQIEVTLKRKPGGYFSGLLKGGGAGTRYQFRLDADRKLYPDPASRYQPEGIHGPSEVIDPGAFRWTDRAWRGVSIRGQVFYEMHVGSFTQEGTWTAAAEQLQELADAGITVIEMMPVNDFPGRFGWSYDGVLIFAAAHQYGRPDDFRAFVNEAHRLGIGVILDVVYNHFGREGNCMKEFSPAYFTDRYDCEWGDAINFDGPDSAPVREFFLSNVRYWIEEFHMDGLRVDATQALFDSSSTPISAEITRTVRAAAGRRKTIVVAESEQQQVEFTHPVEMGGSGMDGLWADDFHHSAMVAITGHNQAYYSDYLGTAQEFVSAAKWGYLYHGQHYTWQKKSRGRPALDVPPETFIFYLMNHDQLANSLHGLRLHQMTSPGKFRAITALFLLVPQTPLLFQGQEFAASSPFYFISDVRDVLKDDVRKGREDFLRQFPNISAPGMLSKLADPCSEANFQRMKLDFRERETHRREYALHKDLIRLRREDPAFSAQRPRGVDGAVLSPHAFVLRYFVDGGMDRLLIVNLGRDLHYAPAPEPLLAPPLGCEWIRIWHSEAPEYGGSGMQDFDSEKNSISGEAAQVLAAKQKEPA